MENVSLYIKKHGGKLTVLFITLLIIASWINWAISYCRQYASTHKIETIPNIETIPDTEDIIVFSGYFMFPIESLTFRVETSGLFVLEVDNKQIHQWIESKADLIDWSQARQDFLLREQENIYTVSLDKTMAPLDIPTYGYGYQWAPNGNTLTFADWEYIQTTNEDGKSDYFYETHIYIVNEDGTNEYEFSDFGGSPDWHPEGNQLIFIGNKESQRDSFVYRMNKNGSDLTRFKRYQMDFPCIRPLGSPQWSPDGTHFAFISDDWSSRSETICVMDADGSHAWSILPDFAQESRYERGIHSFTWSPDSQQIAFASSKDGECFGNSTIFCTAFIYVVNIDGTELEKLTTHRQLLINHLEWIQ